MGGAGGEGGVNRTQLCVVDIDLLLLSLTLIKLVYSCNVYFTLNLKLDISPHLQTRALTKQSSMACERACV